MSAIRVLLIEDSPTYAHLVRSMLSVAKATDFDVVHAERLEDGLHSLEQDGFDVILLDLMLPDSNGLDTLQKVGDRVGSVPVLVLTSVDDEETSLKALHEGAADYLVKSEVSANWLCRAILYAIERARVAAPEEGEREESEGAPASLVMIKQSDDDEGEFFATFTQRRLISVMALERVKLRLTGLIGQERVKTVHLDFSNVDYVANAAISMLLLLNKKATSSGCRLIMENVSEQVHEHFSARRFDRVFDIRR